MGWLNLILEDILNEIKSEEAYAKYYSKMPREEFDKITHGKEDLDKVDQFFLNSVRGDYADADEVVRITNVLYPEEDKSIVNTILNKIRHNEYEYPQEILVDIKILKKFGKTSLKQFENAYKVIGENEEWRASTVFTHAASKAHFCNTHWCTAADNDGGYFNHYTSNAVLIQFVDKKDKNKTYQIQCYIDQPNHFGDSKDFYDHDISPESLKEIVGEDLFNTATNFDFIKKCYDIMSEYAEKESVFSEFEKEKRIVLLQSKNKRINKIRSRLELEIDEFNKNQYAYNEKLVEKVKSEHILENIDFLNMLKDELDYDSHVESSFNDGVKKLSKSYNFVFKQIKIFTKESSYITHSYKNPTDYDALIEVFQSYGILERLGADDDGYPYIDRFINTRSNGEFKRSFIVEIKDNKITQILGSGRHFEVLGHAYDYLFDNETKCLYIGRSREEIPIPNCNIDNIKSRTPMVQDNEYKYEIVFDDSYACKFMLLFDLKTGEYIKELEAERISIPYNYLYRIKPNLYWFYKYMEDGYLFEVPEGCDVIPYDTQSFYYGNNRDVAIKFDNGNAMLLSNTNEFIFGEGINFNYGNTDGRNREKFILYGTTKDRNHIEYHLPEKRYFIEIDYHLKECDKNGDTTKYDRADRYFADWQAKGGHSPEVKAQMDKMWADRNGEEPDRYVDDNTYNADRLGPDYYASKEASQAVLDDILGGKKMDGTPMKFKPNGENGLEPHKDWNGYVRTSSDIDTPNPYPQGENNPYKNKWKNIRIDKNGHDIPDWTPEDEDAVAKRNRDYFKEAGVNESVKNMFRLLKLLND